MSRLMYTSIAVHRSASPETCANKMIGAMIRHHTPRAGHGLQPPLPAGLRLCPRAGDCIRCVCPFHSNLVLVVAQPGRLRERTAVAMSPSNCGIASVALALACRGKGILACDESVGTIGKSARLLSPSFSRTTLFSS